MRITPIFRLFATLAMNIVLAAVEPLTAISIAVGAVGFTYGFTYTTLFPVEEFNVCKLKDFHLNSPDPLLRSRFFSRLTQHFWDSPHAPICVDDIPEPAPPTFTKDLFQQTGLQSKIQFVFDRIPAFIKRGFDPDNRSTWDEFYSDTDRIVTPLIKKTNWYVAKVENKIEMPPTTASVSFQDFAKWSVDVVFDELLPRQLPTAQQFKSQFPVLCNLIDRIGERSLAIFDFAVGSRDFVLKVMPEMLSPSKSFFTKITMNAFFLFAAVVNAVVSCLAGLTDVIKFLPVIMRYKNYLVLRVVTSVIFANFATAFTNGLVSLLVHSQERVFNGNKQTAADDDADDPADAPESVDVKEDGDLYELLGVDSNASGLEISKAYKKLSLKWHPDRPTGDADMSAKLNKAHRILSVPVLRREYDNWGLFDAEQLEAKLNQPEKEPVAADDGESDITVVGNAERLALEWIPGTVAAAQQVGSIAALQEILETYHTQEILETYHTRVYEQLRRAYHESGLCSRLLLYTVPLLEDDEIEIIFEPGDYPPPFPLLDSHLNQYSS